MTTAHKTILSIVAAICLTLIVFYSVKGNAQHPGANPPTPAMATSSKRVAPRADDAANRPSIARTGDEKPASIDEIMAKVKQLDDLKSSSAATIDSAATDTTDTDSRISPARSNTPASTDAPIVALAESSGTGSESPETTAPSAADSTAITPAPAPIDDPSTPPAANSAASVAPAGNTEVPSLTLGESPATSAPSTSDTSSSDTITGEKPRSIFDADVKDLAEVPAISEPLPVPALAKVDPPAESVKAKDEATSSAAPAPGATSTDVGTNTAKAAGTSTAEPKVILIDPHKPAVADETVASREPARSNEATPSATTVSTNTPAEAEKPLPSKSLDVPFAHERTGSSTAPRTYTIKPGDTFSSIAIATYGAEKHWIDIADANPTIDPKKVRVGQVIKLPELDKDDAKPADVRTAAKTPDAKTVDAKADAKAVAKVDAKSAAKTTEKRAESAKVETRIHEVKPGENLITISRRYFKTGDNWRHIYLANRELIGGDPAKLQAGMKLKITPPPLED